MCKIRKSGYLSNTGFKWSHMSVIVAPGNFLTFTNHFWESKLLSIPFKLESPVMQMVHSAHTLYTSSLSSDGRLFYCMTGVT